MTRLILVAGLLIPLAAIAALGFLLFAPYDGCMRGTRAIGMPEARASYWCRHL